MIGKLIIAILLIALCCPLVVLIYWSLSNLFKVIFFRKEVDLSDVVFSKDRIEQVEKTDIESERNIVSIEEAVAVSDFHNQRELMMNVLRKDTSKSLGSISLALNSEDSETSHYAATALRDMLGDFRSKTQQMYTDLKQADRPTFKQLEELVEYIYPMLIQKVFPPSEQESYIDILNEVLTIIEDEYKKDFEPLYYEWIVEMLLSVGKYDEAKEWCGIAWESIPGQLTPYKCLMRYYYSIHDGESFRNIMNELKASDIMIDSDTLEILRTFS